MREFIIKYIIPLILGLLGCFIYYKISMYKYNKEKEKNKEILSSNVESFQKYFLEEFALHFVTYEHYVSKINEVEAKWKNKIKDKIEEYDDEINQLRIDRNVTFDSLIYRNSIKKDALQELLEDKSK